MEENMNLELIVVGEVPTITSNFDALKSNIAARLETYKIQVTEDNLQQAKKDATELGKFATELNKRKTEKAKEYSAPVEAFKAQVMELVVMIQEGQDFIKRQVAVFEDKTRKLCHDLMTEMLKLEYVDRDVRPEYQTGFNTIPDLVGISKVTKGGELTKAAKENIAGLAQAGRGTQDMVDGRISKLEAECFKAGLKTPLQKEHVEAILLNSDADCQKAFEKLIKIEVRRQEDTLKAEQARMEAEAKHKAEAESKAKFDAEQKIAKEKNDAELAAQLKVQNDAWEKRQACIKAAEEKAKETAKLIAEFEARKIPEVPVNAPAFEMKPNQGREVIIRMQFRIQTHETSESEIEKYFTEMIATPEFPGRDLIIEATFEDEHEPAHKSEEGALPW